VTFLRSAVIFDGLTRGEIFSRLFLWWFGPGFVALFFDLLFRSTVYRDPLVSFVGPVLTVAVVWHDARRAGLSNAPILAVVAGAIPLLGWLYYAYVRAPRTTPASATAPALPANRPGTLRRLLDPFASERVVLVTALSASECSDRLQRSKVSLLAPSSWFSLNRDRPVHGRVSVGGFALKRRHPMTREGLITQASGRYEDRLGSTLIHIRIGLSLFDRVFTILWLGFVAMSLLIFSGSGSVSLQERWMFPIFMVLIFALVYVLVRLIALNDDAFLYRFLLSRLEAQDVTEREPV